MKKRASAITMVVVVILVAMAGVMFELSIQIPFSTIVKIGIETQQLNLVESAHVNLSPTISLTAFMTGAPSSMSGGLVMYPFLASDRLSSCGTSVTGSENRAESPIVVLTEKHACVADLQNVTVILTAYLLSGHITVKLYSATGLLAIYDGTGAVTMTFGCDILSNRHRSVNPPGL